MLALAPDAASQRAAAGLGPPRWSGAGAAGDLVWGLCAGSAKQPYQAIVDLAGPAYKCSCPSRKFPCKHALALLLNWSAGAVLASIRAVKTSLIVFDTAVADLTEKLSDPVDVLFGTQLGGGTDINKAIAYSQTLITRPRDSIFVLISDLMEGGVREQMLARIAALDAAWVQVIVLLALSDEGAPVFDKENAAALAELGIPAFACTPDAFPELLAVAIDGGDVAAWAHRSELAAREPLPGH